MKVIIDTAIWSKAYRRKKTKDEDKNTIETLRKLIDYNMEIIIGPIRQELLSGISDEIVFNDLKEKMTGFNDYSIETNDYELAALYYNICRRNGIQGSNTDFLICAIAVRNKFEIFTSDDDFKYYKEYLPIKLFDKKQ
jgi:predicted nucleic acid-binding protein